MLAWRAFLAALFELLLQPLKLRDTCTARNNSHVEFRCWENLKPGSHSSNLTFWVLSNDVTSRRGFRIPYHKINTRKYLEQLHVLWEKSKVFIHIELARNCFWGFLFKRNKKYEPVDILPRLHTHVSFVVLERRAQALFSLDSVSLLHLVFWWVLHPWCIGRCVTSDGLWLQLLTPIWWHWMKTEKNWPISRVGKFRFTA